MKNICSSTGVPVESTSSAVSIQKSHRQRSRLLEHDRRVLSQVLLTTDLRRSFRPRAFRLPLFVMTSRGQPEAPQQARIAERNALLRRRLFRESVESLTEGGDNFGSSGWWKGCEISGSCAV